MGKYWKTTFEVGLILCVPCSKSNLLHYLLTSWSRVLLEKLTGFQLAEKFPAFYGTRRFITAFTKGRQLSLSSASSIQSKPPHPTSWRSLTTNSTKASKFYMRLWCFWRREVRYYNYELFHTYWFTCSELLFKRGKTEIILIFSLLAFYTGTYC